MFAVNSLQQDNRQEQSHILVVRKMFDLKSNKEKSLNTS